jgi:hypothetical protein
MLSPRFVGSEHVELQLARYDIATNEIERTLVHLRPQGLDFVTSHDAYAAPGELDVMAEATGFRLLARSSGWSGEVYTARVPAPSAAAVYDVGHGNCNALLDSAGFPGLYFDFGGGVLANRKSFPSARCSG